MQSLLGSKCCLEDLRGEGNLITDTRGNLPPEIWRCIVEFLPSDCNYALAMSKSTFDILSILAWELCLRRPNFVDLKDQERLGVLRKLYMQRDNRLDRLKSLLRLMEVPLEKNFRRLLLEEAIRQNDEELSSLSLLHSGDEEDLAAGLTLAVKHRQSDMIEFFLAKKAQIDVNWVTGEPLSSLRIACDRRDIRLINWLLSYDSLVRTILHVAASFGCYDIVQNLQESQEFARLREVKDCSGHLPIQWAVFEADVQMVQLLASLGSSIHIRDQEDYNLLHITVTRSMWPTQREEAYKILLKWLIAKGCDQTALNNSGETPLECAKSQRAPQWAIDMLQMHANASMDINADGAVPEAKGVTLGQNPNHPIMFPDDEEQGHTFQRPQDLTRCDSFIPVPPRGAAGLCLARALIDVGTYYQHTNAPTSTRRIGFKTPHRKAAKPNGLRRSRRIKALF
ncbi:uncharacterized protein N7511_008445 [Penicillium nucicola]|uniref:uncharacterized protein n=1 Tax=Penicillium nucicola TaxID=1850975 RepID=UPI002544F170|nr:uncharacterized protein N7511_008445 [Penicillium nucicola]KAJ5751480.1 hypothetical protein N7511_008445 [Penicillium nucicola]